jgi:hypothetical protein
MLFASRRIVLAVLVLVAVGLGPRDAAAIRPFDGTDAAVTDPGTIELELSPITWRRARGDDLVAPALVVNLGLAPGWEISASGQATWGLHDEPGEAARGARLRRHRPDAQPARGSAPGRAGPEHRARARRAGPDVARR